MMSNIETESSLKRLTAREEDDLRFYFRSYASRIGLRSSYSALVAAMNGVHSVATPESADPYASVIDDITRAKRVYRALKRVDEAGGSFHLTVLNLIYGEPHPNAPYLEFGKSAFDLAALARFTDAAEESRAEMVASMSASRKSATESNVRAHRSRSETDARKASARRAAVEEELASILEDKRDCRARGVLDVQTEEEAAWERSLRDERSRWSAAERDATSAALAEPTADRSTRTIRAGTEAELSTSDAVRTRLTYHGPRDGAGKPEKASHSAWEVSKNAFVTKMKSQAAPLRDAACDAYATAARATAKR